jgi:hypothetical protein
MANFTEILFSNIKNEVELYLKTEHSKANLLFSPASPYGQILAILENFHQLSMLYLKNSLSQFDLGEANRFNPRAVRNAAILAGHIPGRAISATGTLKLTVNRTVDLEKEVNGSRITYSNRLRIKNNTNSLNYCFNMGVESRTEYIRPDTVIYIPIIQGELKSRVETGDGTINQTFNITEIVNGDDVENFNVEVLVNGKFWEIKKHIYELLPDEYACVVRTGFNGGIDVIFGNGGFGAIPEIASYIEIRYISTKGSAGNIFRRTVNDWKFLDDVVDANGETVDMAKVFNIEIFNDINFGADAEPLSFTRSVLPIASNNFVLGLPQQFAYEIKKLGVFSHVNAYEKTGTIFIVATPNINLFRNQNSDYFTIPIDAFVLDDYEKSKIRKYIQTSGNLMLTRKYKIDSPKLSYYVMNVSVIIYSDATEDSVNAQILSAISDYFLNLGRIDRIPKLDIIRVISSIPDIHSADVNFVSRKNEEYHRNGQQAILNSYNNKFSNMSSQLSRSGVPKSYDPSSVIGIDPVMGDILFEPDEVPVIRGGWRDRLGLYYYDSVETNQLKSVNIIKKGTIDSKNRPV